MTFDARADFVLVLPTTDGAGNLLAADAVPTCRVYGAAGFVGSPAAAPFQTAAVTDAQPQGGGSTRLTAAGHPFVAGDVVKVAGVLGATGANGVWVVQAVTANTLDILHVPGGTYAGGGTVTAASLYAATVTADIRSLLEPGKAYTAVWRFAVATVPAVVSQPFTVV